MCQDLGLELVLFTKTFSYEEALQSHDQKLYFQKS